MDIPKSFTIGPHRWKVLRVSEARMRKEAEQDDDEETHDGLTEWNTNTIFLLRDLQGSKMAHAFWHEYFHVLLFSAGKEELSYDEGLVDMLGLLTAQAIATMRS